MISIQAIKMYLLQIMFNLIYSNNSSSHEGLFDRQTLIMNCYDDCKANHQNNVCISTMILQLVSTRSQGIDSL